MLDAGAIRKVLAKEIREGRRDRNLLLNVILIPLFLYPLLGFGILQVLQIVRGIADRTTTVVALAGEVPAAVRDSLAAGTGILVIEALPSALDPAGFRAWREERSRREEPVPHALLEWRPGAAGDTARILHDAAKDRSADARSRIEAAVDAWRERRAEEAAARVGVTPSDLDRFRIESENTASAVQRGREILASGLPLILLLMLSIGIAAAALDTVVGERERGTMETILVSPLARGEVLLGKYLFVLLAAMVAFALNLVSMSAFLGFVLRLLDVGEEIRIGIDPLSLLLVFGAALLTAALLAAVFMVIAIPARTYREGQAAVGPAYLLAMVPGLVVAASHEPFGLSQAFVPVLNSTALFEAVLRGQIEPVPVAVTYVVLAVTTAAALAVASRIASREDVFLEPKLSLSRLLRGRSAS